MSGNGDKKYVKIEGDLHRRLKLLSVSRNRLMHELASEAVMEFLERAQRAPEEVREPLRSYNEKRPRRRKGVDSESAR
jgi:predicted transcriptional regulator